MADGNDQAMKTLIEYKAEIEESLQWKTCLSPEKLLAIREHIQSCNSLEKRPLEKTVFFQAVRLWRDAYSYWLKHRTREEAHITIPDLAIGNTKSSTALVKRNDPPSKDPKKPWELNDYDLKFLKSLRLAKGDKLSYPDEEDDEKDNKKT